MDYILESSRRLKALFAYNGLSLKDLCNLLMEKNQKKDTAQNISNKLSRGTLRFSEVLEIADVMGYDIDFKKRI